MDLKRISASTVALLVAALVVLATGVYTDNGGFRLAGILLLVTGILVALGQARDQDGPP